MRFEGKQIWGPPPPLLPPGQLSRFVFEKTEKCLESPEMGRKLIEFVDPLPDMCAEKFPLVSMGA
jgi:hypothetical protein